MNFLDKPMCRIRPHIVSGMAAAAMASPGVSYAAESKFTDKLCTAYQSIYSENEKLAFVIGAIAFIIFFVLFIVDDKAHGGIARVLQIVLGITGMLAAPSLLGWFGVSPCGGAVAAASS